MKKSHAIFLQPLSHSIRTKYERKRKEQNFRKEDKFMKFFLKIIFISKNFRNYQMTDDETFIRISYKFSVNIYLRNSSVLLGVTQLWHVAHWVSPAAPPHTLPAFPNLNGTIIKDIQINKIFIRWMLKKYFSSIEFDFSRQTSSFKSPEHSSFIIDIYLKFR